MPLIMRFRDGNTKHYNLGNVQLLCYNCYFLYYGTVFEDKGLQNLEGVGSVLVKTEEDKFKLDSYQIKKLKELGLHEGEDDDPYSLVSFK